MRVVPDPAPKRRAPNTVYLGYDGRPSFMANLVYRVYLPDRDCDQFGGTGLPEVAVRLADGTEVDQPAACSAPTNQPSTGMLRGRLPDVPETYDGQRRFERAPLRYWSLCNGSVQPYGVTDTVGCVHDEQVATDGRGFFTIVVSTPEHRPANAYPACGVTWLPWGARPNAALIMRNQLPSPWFAQAIQRARAPGTERAVMGEYLPRGRYTTADAFARRGC